MNYKVSVIIPAFYEKRNSNVEKLKLQLANQSIKPNEVLIVKGVFPNGKARNSGVVKASGEFYIFIDDDVTLGHDNVIENMLKPLLENKKVGLTGASQIIPEDSTWFQRISSKQIPRSTFPVQKELVDSDMVTHACLCMPAKIFREIGMENPEIVSGTDPDLRHRTRQAGYRVCIVPDTWVYHPAPASLRALLSSAFIKGRNSAIVRKTHPELIYETDDELTRDFTPRKGLGARIARMAYRIFYMLFTLKIFGFAFYIAYSIGNAYGTIKKSPE